MRAKTAILIAAGVVAALVFGLFDVRQRARLDRGLSRHRTDFTVYTAASEAMFAGEDPYTARSPRGWRYVYPPLLAIVVRPLTFLSVPDAAFAWYLLSVVALVVAALLLVRAIGPPTGRLSVFVALVICAGFLLQTFQRGQVTIFLLALQVGGLVCAMKGKGAWSGLLLALGVALRLTPLLPAAMVGIGALAARDPRRVLAYGAGGVAGLVIGFLVVPVVALGPARALEVTKRWVEVSREVYAAEPGQAADLERDFAIREHSFKNQGVRRVLATWTAWITGASLDDTGKPELGDREADVDAAATGVALAVGLLALVIAARGMRDPTSARFRRYFAVGMLLPVLVTRYAWPIHFVVAIPFVAECVNGLPRSWSLPAAIVFLAGMGLFYAAHLPDYRVLADAGCLALAVVVAIGLALFSQADPMPRPAP